MYRVQNLKNKDIRFQDVTIKAYGFYDFNVITDYLTLSRLTNSGKARYFAVQNNPAPAAEVKAKTVEKPVEIVEKEVETVVEPVIVEEVVKDIVEDTVTTKENETLDKVEETENKTADVQVQTKKYGKKGKRNTTTDTNE